MSAELATRWETIPTTSPVRDTVGMRILRNPSREVRGVVVFCHGLGMGAATYEPLQRAWASAGLAVVAPEFGDSLPHLAAALPDAAVDVDDPTAWMSDPTVVEHALGLMFDEAQWAGRAMDCLAVIDHLEQLATTAHDDARCVVVGHSYGAHTAQLVAGARAQLATGSRSFRHPHVVGAAVLSPQGSGERGLTSDSWAGIDVPWLVVSGEHDTAARGQGLAWRREAYDHAPPGGRQLVVARGADHGLGGIAGSAPIYRDDTALATAMADLTSTFVDAALDGTPLPVATDPVHFESEWK